MLGLVHPCIGEYYLVDGLVARIFNSSKCPKGEAVGRVETVMKMVSYG